MQKSGIFTSSAITMVVALLVLIGVPVFAMEGSSDTSTTTESTEMQEKEGTEAEPEMRATSEKHSRLATAEGQEDGLRKEGAQLLADAKKKHKSEKSSEARAKSCENRKKGLEQKFTRIALNSERFQTRIKSIQEKAENYKVANNVELANYDALLVTANTAAEESAAAIDAMSALKPTIDCTSNNVASDVATFKAAAQDTRDKLKAYKMTVKALLTALHDAKVDTTEGDN